MNISRKYLERMGEPLGDSVTLPKLGGGYVCGGGGGKSKSSSATTNNDGRLVADGGAAVSSFTGVTNSDIADDGSATLRGSHNNTITIQSVAPEIFDSAMGTVDAVLGDGLDRLLTISERLFEAGGQVLDTTAQTSMAALQAVGTARNDAEGSIDQKTLVIMGGVVLGAALLLRKG